MKQDVICVSLINLNILVRPVGPDVFTRDATVVEDYNIVVGGDGTNQAVVLSSLGRKAGVAGKIGKDALGQIAMQMLEQRGVDHSLIRVDEQEQTAICLVMIGNDGNRNFVIKRGACDHFSLSDVDLDAITEARVLNIGSLFTFRALYGDDLAKLLAHARAKGLITCADSMYDSYQIGADVMRPVLKYLDYFLPSYEEARYLTGLEEPERMAQALLDLGVKTVGIKLGGEGCLLADGTQMLRLPVFSVPVVDTTGAGDNFIAGFLHGVLQGWNLKQCGQFASAASAISIQSVGATGAVTSAAQVHQFLQQHHIIIK